MASKLNLYLQKIVIIRYQFNPKHYEKIGTNKSNNCCK